MTITGLDAESPEYQSGRAALLSAELKLMRQREHVAELRRSLPPGPIVDDYEFIEGPDDLRKGDEPARNVHLRDLFTTPDRPLIVYHLMFGKSQTTPCPMCTCWIDGFNGVAHHITQRANFAVIAAATLHDLRRHARDRGWDHLRLLSCGDNSFKKDLGSEDESGSQDSEVSVFTLDPDGSVRHFYSSHPWFDEDVNQRGIDLLNPVWHLFDLMPTGRGDWYASLSYETESAEGA